jgi:nicotinamidase-related amidase
MKPALLVIDVQRGLFDPQPRPFEADAVLGRIRALASGARKAGVPVVYIQHQSQSGFLVEGSEDWQLERSLDVQPGDTLVHKTTPDSFLRTTLTEHLARWGCDHLVICGYATEYCVDTTTRRALALGFPVTLVSDAHTTHDAAHASAALIRSHHNVTLSQIRSFGPRAVLVPADSVTFEVVPVTAAP